MWSFSQKSCFVVCLLINFSGANAEQRTSDSLNLFNVSLGQAESTAVAVLRQKAAPKLSMTFCVSEWIANQGDRNRYEEDGSCLESAELKIKLQDGEIKGYAVEFWEQYRTKPGSGAVSAIEYRHSWDAKKVTPSFDPYQMASKRFGRHHGEHVNQNKKHYWWKFNVDGNTVKVTLGMTDYFWLTDGFVLRVEYDWKDVKEWEEAKYKYIEDNAITSSGSAPDF